MVNLDGKTILVTGGCGFIGSNFIEYILKNYSKMTVLNIDKMGVGSRDFYPKIGDNSYIHFNKDIRILHNMYITSSWFLPGVSKIDYVFHFAAESHVDRSIQSPMDFIDNNVKGLTSLLEYIRLHQKQARVINVSTDEVYGHLGKDDEPFTENSPLKPRSPYAASKASADLIAGSYFTTYGLDIITTRCCNNYGPYQYEEKFIPKIIKSITYNLKIPVYGNGMNIREWIYVDDHIKSILEIADFGKSGLVYNIGSEIELSNLDMVKILLGEIKDTGDIDKYIEYVDDRKGHDFRYAIRSVNFERSFKLEDFWGAINKTIDHYIK